MGKGRKIYMMIHRPRRLRRHETLRSLVRENFLDPVRWVYPLFIKDHDGREPISSLHGISRLGPKDVLAEIKEAYSLGVKSFALFPKISDHLKDPTGKLSRSREDIVPVTIKRIKDSFPDCVLLTDVALDPYSTEGHDGLVKDNEILNDETIKLLMEQALVQAEAGTDFVAPSDMMDGRVAYIRKHLDQHGFQNVGVWSYTAKYASCFYGPFREALDSAPKFGDKKSYQMDPANKREALRELQLDLQEGADVVMVKPAGAYLDIISLFKSASNIPVAAYQVSGEYAMMWAAHEKGWIDGDKALIESLTSIHRAGADIIITYGALKAAKLLQ
jgi:porphobilinogen synthase